MKGFLKVAAALFLCFGLVRVYSVYKAQAAPILPGVLIGGFDFHEVGTAEEVTQSLQDRFEQPVLVTFNHVRDAVSAEEVGLHVDVDRILTEADTYMEGVYFLRSTLQSLLGLPLTEHSVPLYFGLTDPGLEPISNNLTKCSRPNLKATTCALWIRIGCYNKRVKASSPAN